MTRKTKWIIGYCVLAFLAFMGNLWYQDYQNTHEIIEIETPTADTEVRG